jgi:hypothetical protein
MPTKDEITKELNRLRNFGYGVYHFNNNQWNNKGNEGFPDHVIIGKGKIIFIEVKRKGDSYSEKQRETRDYINSTIGGVVSYYCVEELIFIKGLVDELLEGG